MGVYFRAGSWYWRYQLAPGRRLKKGGYPSKRAAEDAERVDRVARGALPREAGQRLDFVSATTRYLEQARLANPRTAARAFALMGARWKGRTLDGLTVRDVTAWQAWRRQQPAARRRAPEAPTAVAGSTVNRELAALSALYGWAQREGHVPPGFNPAARRLVPRDAEDWRPWQSLPEAALPTFLAAFPAGERPKIELLFELGVRLAVILRLQWEQVDLAAGLLHYTSKRRSVVRSLTPRARVILQALGPRARGPVFSTTSDTAIRRAWPDAVAAVGLDAGFRRHDLRVTMARRAARAGVNLKTIASLLGHATITMASRYIPVDLDDQQAAVARMSAPPMPGATRGAAPKRQRRQPRANRALSRGHRRQLGTRPTRRK